MNTGLLLVAALAVLLAPAYGVNPGLKAAVSQKGLDYIKDIGSSVLEAKIGSISIPKQSFEKLSIDCSISNFKFSGLSFDSAVSVDPTKGLILKVSNLAATIDASWTYREKIWPHIPHGDGMVKVVLGNTAAEVGVLMTVVGGKPKLTASECSSNVDITSLEFHGGLTGDLLDLFKSIIKSKVNGLINSQLCSKVNELIDTDGNTFLSKYSLRLPVPLPAPLDIASVDMSLTSGPSNHVDFVGLSVKAEVEQTGSTVQPPMAAGPLPDYEPTSLDSHMFQIFLSEYMFNTAAWTFWDAKALSLQVTPSMVPAASPIKLNTSILSDIAPGVFKTYPNMGMTLTVAASAAPSLAITAASQNVTADITLDFQVMAPTGLVPVFTLGCPLQLDADLWIVDPMANGGQGVGGKVSVLSCELALVSNTSGGAVVVSDLQGLVGFALNFVAVPAVNKLLAKGVPLPAIDGVSLTSSLLSFGEGYARVTTDVTYTPPGTLQSAAAVAKPAPKKAGGHLRRV